MSDMSNPYLDEADDPTPQPTPAPLRASRIAWLALAIAVVGLFLPGGIDFDKLPIPIPPFVEPAPVVDPADTEGSWVVVIEQTEQRTPEQATLMRNTPYWDSLKARGLNWRHYDYDSDDAKDYRETAKEVGMPAVAIVQGRANKDGEHKLLAKFKLPAQAELDAKIKEATGR